MAITDDFDRADSGTLGANWEDLVGGHEIVSNAAQPDTNSTINRTRYIGTFPANHYSEVITQITDATNHYYSGPSVRMDGSGNCYYANLFTSFQEIRGFIGGVDTALFSGGLTLASSTNLTVKLVATGTTIELFVDTVSSCSGTDGNNIGGNPGLASKRDDAFSPGRVAIQSFAATDPTSAGRTFVLSRF